MPRIPQSQPRSAREFQSTPFAGVIAPDLSPITKFGEQLLEEERKLKLVEELGEASRAVHDAERDFVRKREEIGSMPDFELHPEVAVAEARIVELKLKERLKDMRPETRLQAMRQFNESALRFELDVAKNSRKLRLDRVEAGVENDLAQFVITAGEQVTPADREALITRGQARLELAVASGVFDRTKATQRLNTFKKEVLLEGARGLIRRDPDAFSISVANGEFSGLAQSDIDTLTAHNNQVTDRIRTVLDREKELRRKEAMTYLESQAMVGKLNVQWAQFQHKSQVITTSDFTSLLEINRKRPYLQSGAGADAIEQVRIKTLSRLITSPIEEASTILGGAAEELKRMAEAGVYGHVGTDGKTQLSETMKELRSFLNRDEMEFMREALEIVRTKVPTSVDDIIRKSLDPAFKQFRSGDRAGARKTLEDAVKPKAPGTPGNETQEKLDATRSLLRK